MKLSVGSSLADRFYSKQRLNILLGPALANKNNTAKWYFTVIAIAEYLSESPSREVVLESML